MAEDFCRRALPVLDRLVLSALSPGDCLLDLCCGSGQLARALTRRGFRVVGIDASDEMLRLARSNAPDAHFVSADAVSFRSPQRFDAALSTFNSMAHFTTVADLARVFRNVHEALLPGAPFVFDLSMEEAYASKWRGSFALIADDHACIVEPSYDAERQTGTNRITVFSMQASSSEQNASLFCRSNFAITQKCHSETDLRAALAAAGFSDIRSFDAQRDLSMPGEAGRTFFLCR